MDTTYENRLAIIASLRQRGVTIELAGARMHDAGFDAGDTADGDMWIRAPKGVLIAEEVIGLKDNRDGLTHALRLSEGYCGVCGVVPATRPKPRWRSEKCQYCEVCFWNTVNPIVHRLSLTDTQRRREDKANDRTDEVCTAAALPTLL